MPGPPEISDTKAGQPLREYIFEIQVTQMDRNLESSFHRARHELIESFDKKKYDNRTDQPLQYMNRGWMVHKMCHLTRRNDNGKIRHKNDAGGGR